MLEEQRLQSAASFLHKHCPAVLLKKYEQRPTYNIRKFLRQNLGIAGWRQEADLLDRLRHGRTHVDRQVDLARLMCGGLTRADKTSLWGEPLRQRPDGAEALRESEPQVFDELRKIQLVEQEFSESATPDSSKVCLFKDYMGEDMLAPAPTWLNDLDFDWSDFDDQVIGDDEMSRLPPPCLRRRWKKKYLFHARTGKFKYLDGDEEEPEPSPESPRVAVANRVCSLCKTYIGCECHHRCRNKDGLTVVYNVHA